MALPAFSRRFFALAAVLFCALAWIVPAPRSHAESPRREQATFAAGCFWGVQAKFDKTKGVLKTTVGYTGGTTKSPSYEQVLTHKTGHAEAIEIEFDPSVVTYAQLVDLFFTIHDPTQLNRQGPDIGTNYRSAIFYHSPEQKAVAEATKEKLNAKGQYDGKIVTEIAPAGPFYPAEEYHQKYIEKTGAPVCY